MLITEVSSIYLYQTARTAWENIGPRKTHFLAYQVEGRYEHTVNGKVYPVSAGGLFFINQKDSYSVKCLEKGYSLCVAFCAETKLPTTLWDMRDTPSAYNDFLRLMPLKNLTDKSNYYQALSILYQLFSTAFCKRNAPQQGNSPTHCVILAADYLSTHFDDHKIRTESLAKLYGISEKYFRTLFKKHYGVTPSQYLTNLRLTAAKNLLNQGGLTMTEIADMVGISDVYYFSKLFKQHSGCPPSKFKQIPQESLNYFRS